MSADIDKGRADFEAWAVGKGWSIAAAREESADTYMDTDTEIAWYGWQAARATPSPAPIQQSQQEDKATVEWITEKILSYTRPETPRDHEAAQRCARVIRTAFDRAAPTVKVSQS